MLDKAKSRAWWTYFKLVMVMLLNELIDSDGEKPTSGKTRE